jgi:hypothetical protein
MEVIHNDFRSSLLRHRKEQHFSKLNLCPGCGRQFPRIERLCIHYAQELLHQGRCPESILKIFNSQELPLYKSVYRALGLPQPARFRARTNSVVSTTSATSGAELHAIADGGVSASEWGTRVLSVSPPVAISPSPPTPVACLPPSFLTGSAPFEAPASLLDYQQPSFAQSCQTFYDIFPLFFGAQEQFHPQHFSI